MALSDSLKTDMSGISPLIDAARSPKEPQSLVKMPAAQRFGEDDVGTIQAQVRSGQTRLDRSYAEQERLIGETGNLTSQLAQQTANLVAYKNEQELFKAKQQEAAAKADSENITKMLDEIRGGPLYKQKQETNKQIAEYSAFVPTEVTAPMLGVLFATIGATGMLLGGNSKNTAKAALSAMNGMAEGFGKGREQYDKERKQAFDSNVKLLQTKLSAINDGLEDARKEAVLNKQAADLKVRETLAANDAQFLQENTNRRGLESTIELVKGQLASLKTSLELQKTKTNQIENQLQRQSDNLMLKNIQISATQASQQMQRDFLRGMQEDRQAAQIEADKRRAEAREQDIRLTASLRPERGQGAGQTQRATQQQAITQRAVNSLGGVASALETIVELPQGSTTGWLPNLQTKDGMFNAIRNQLGRKISPVDAELMNTTFTGIGRNLAAIESSGLASGLSTLANQMEKGTYISAGVDDPYKVAMKLADIKRIATENIQPSIDSGLMTDKQAKTAQELVNRIEKIIPYNTRDVAIAYREATSRTRGKPTVGQSSAQVVKPGEGWSDRDERRLQELEEKARGSQPK
jgi:hypothetical protein